MDERGILEFLNGLNEEEKNALEIAVLLGNTFSLDHLIELANIKPSKLLKLLDEMAKLNIIKQKAGSDKGVFFFRKKSFSNIILKSMDEEKRRLYLSNIINFLERELPEDDKKPLILAELHLKFRKDKDYLQHMKKAADLLTLAHKTDEALDLYKEIIDSLLMKDRNPLETLILIDSVISYAPIAINIFPPEEIYPILDKAISLADNLKNNRAKAMLELCLGRLYQCQGNNKKASVHYRKGWRLAQGIADSDVLKMASKLFALSLFWQGRMREAIQMYEGTIENVEKISPDLRDLWAYLMLAYCYGIIGRVARGVGLAEAIRERALSKGYRKTHAFADAVIALIFLEVRQIENAEPHINEALEIGEKIGSDLALWMAKPCKAYELYSKDDLKGAKKILESAISHAKKLGQIHYPSPWFIEILWALDKAKLKPLEGYSFNSEINRLINWPDIYMKGAALRYYALSKKISGADFKEIKRLLEESQDLLIEAGAYVELGRTQVELAKLFVERDRRQAKELAEKAYQTFSKIDSSLFPSELLSLIRGKSKENRLLQGILEFDTAISSLPDKNTYLRKVVTIFTDMFGAERAAILLIQDKNSDESLKIVATRNFSPEEIQQLKNEPLRHLILSTVEKKQPLIIADSKKSRNLLQISTDNFPIKSLACIPLVLDGKGIGLVYIDNRLLKGIFSKKDLVIMTAIATQIAISLKTTTLYEKFKNLQDSLNKESFYPDQVEPNLIQSDAGLPQIIGKSDALKNVLIKLKKVAKTDATVLILGETGVGKELIARTIHKLSHRANNPFIVVNVSALTENLLSSELFGYERGAFTGAVKSKIGRFEMANGGTIFLDEIGDLSMDAQVKLLRVLQEGEFERVGGTQTIRSDFRLIAATNRDLPNMVAKGDFRSDLFYRINTFPIEIPPLRERKEDIPPLALHFMKKYAKKNQKDLKRIPGREMKKLLDYSWPGNVRELEHIIERAVILSENDTLIIPDFEQYPSSFPKKDQNQPELLPLDEIERRHIIRVLNHVKWRIRGEQGAAKILGLKPTTLEFRMKKLGIKK